MHVLLVVNIVIRFIILTIILFTLDAKKNVQKFAVLLVVLVVLLVSVAITVVGGMLLTPAFITHTSIMIPNVTSSRSIFQAQSTPLVVLLDEFNSENYSSFIIASTIYGSSTSDIPSKIWIAPEIYLTNSSYSKDDIILPSTSYDIHFYALPGSIFNVTFPSLSGLDGTYVLVELREFVESGLNGSVLQSQSVKPSTGTQSVIFTLEISGFVAIFLANEGASGTFGYNITIKGVACEGAEYICTVNSTTTCNSTSVYDNNYILAETTLESATVYPIITLTIVGKEKPTLTRVNVLFLILFAVIAIIINTFIFGCLVKSCVRVLCKNSAVC